MERCDIFWPDMSGGESHFFQEAQCCSQFFVDRGGTPIIQDGLNGVVCKFFRRNCAVNACSILAGIFAGDESGEQFAFANSPLRGFAQDFLYALNEVSAEQFRPVG